MLEYPDKIAVILYNKVIGVEISAVDQCELDAWVEKDASNRELLNFLLDDKQVKSDFLEYYNLKLSGTESAIPSLFQSDPVTESKHNTTFFKKFLIAAAASILAAIGGYVIFSAAEQKNTRQANRPFTEISVPAAKDMVMPAVQRASLSISDQTIGLTTNSSIEVEKDGTITIGGLAEKSFMNSPDAQTPSGALYTLTTPRGGYYQVTLSDGTRVWLNAASILKFPKKFESNQRKVQLTGEAYFDVSKNPGRPFIVETQQGNVQVLGTTFNLKTYEHEPMVTSLITGAVQILAGPERQSSRIIAPGQQAIVRSDASTIQVSKFDNNPAAWRQDVFSFEGTQFDQVLREISRWYDVEVQFKDGVTNNAILKGEFDRKLPLEKLLPHLSELGGVQLDLLNRTIIVSHK